MVMAEAQVEVRDRVLWIPHIHGGKALAERLERLAAGETTQLKVDGRVGVWEKMRDRPDGSPTPGLKPIGAMGEHWRALFQKRRKALVDIADGAKSAQISARTDEERAAAWQAILDATRAGWRSEAPYGPRDELYER
jgi:hypothetical protein